MKRIVFLLAAVSLALSAAKAQDKAEQSVARAVEQFRQAMVEANGKVLNNMCNPKLSYGHSGGKVEDKPTFIGNILNGNSDFVTISLVDQTIQVSGNVAIVRHTLIADTNDKGKAPGKIELKILTVWQKEGGAWKLLARQAVKPH